MAHARLESSEAKNDRAKIFEMMELLKAKYVTLTQEKSALHAELIRVREHNKLTIRRGGR